jgi:hypothetical protein
MGKNRTEAEIVVYSLAGHPAKVWRDPGFFGRDASPDGSGTVSWSRGGLLAFNWYTGHSVRILNTRTAGGSLRADSRLGATFVQPGGWSFLGNGILTTDGTKIVAPLQAARLALKPVPHIIAEIEEFSTATGKPVRVLHRGGGVEWTSPSGSVLVLWASLKINGTPVLGVLAGNRFTRIPGAPPVSSLLVQVIAF